MGDEASVQRYRSVFISDIHLGTRECQAERLLDFIRELDCEQLYLVGDIVDGWRLRAGWFWPQTHNDVVSQARWRAWLGHWAYRALLNANTGRNRLRGRLGLGHWSFAAFLKARVKSAALYIARYEESVAAEAARRGCDGVICGHIHHPARRPIAGVTYVNDGDWVESCTAAVEHFDGRIEVIARPGPAAVP